MTDTEILSEMIKSPVQTSEEYGKLLVKLYETQAPDVNVEIRDLPEDAVIIKADDFPPPDTIFKGEKGECCRADYILISEKEKCILYIELKQNLLCCLNL